MTARSVVLAALVLIGSLFVGCSDSENATPEPTFATLTGTTWRALSVAARSTVAGAEPTIAFEVDRVSGSGGCNRYGGPYTYVDGVLTFGEMSMTAIGCPEPIMAIENAFIRTLSAVKGSAIDSDGRLILNGPGGQVILVMAAR
jgi:heat shock protein HslJ